MGSKVSLQHQYLSLSDSFAVLEALSRSAKSWHLRDPVALGMIVTLWFQKSDSHPQDFYVNLGFRVVQELKLGEERCDKSGNSDRGLRQRAIVLMTMMDSSEDHGKGYGAFWFLVIETRFAVS